ncbi:uncharacterized protein LOC125753664 [Canis lupus dingo]|uniref:uncharacterized protein LOC125753664 n=1 Tax=Canis lupus dingo TaxID=286419 RepID=UPI0020C307CF|nr:uncharacterized protein LOC125753664 [Canis lupus dingo]
MRGAGCGTRPRVSGIAAWAEGGAKPLRHPGIPRVDASDPSRAPGRGAGNTGEYAQGIRESARCPTWRQGVGGVGGVRTARRPDPGTPGPGGGGEHWGEGPSGPLLLATYFYLFIFKRFYLFIHERQRERQARCGEPDVGLDRSPQGSRPEPKAEAQPLSHPGAPGLIVLMSVVLRHSLRKNNVFTFRKNIKDLGAAQYGAHMVVSEGLACQNMFLSIFLLSFFDPTPPPSPISLSLSLSLSFSLFFFPKWEGAQARVTLGRVGFTGGPLAAVWRRSMRPFRNCLQPGLGTWEMGCRARLGRPGLPRTQSLPGAQSRHHQIRRLQVAFGILSAKARFPVSASLMRSSYTG